ncbi:hypothetical protein CCACVL1_28822 [Corchorus capsularis]|uniref:Uncharacterized protein n=1 Tax=Corchorus capsularis TaxID=210143 RepID=A0A1R3G580_COCAP|nr:hypothetical protein CCACVL1_28822 [Corchorus capsularis]
MAEPRKDKGGHARKGPWPS